MKPNGRRHIEHAGGYHDDRIIALYIALYVAHDSDMTAVAEDRRKWQEQRSIPQAEVREFQTLGLGWEAAMEKWENELVGW